MPEEHQPEVNQSFLMYVAEVSEIPPEDLEKLFYNGFDNPDSIELCTIENLVQLQVENAEEVLQRLHLTIQFWREKEGGQQQEKNMFDYEANGSVEEEEEEDLLMPNLPNDARNLTYDLLLGDTKKKPRQFHLPYLNEMTHLKMQKKRLSSLITVNEQQEIKPLLGQYCTRLTHVFLQDNYLTFIGQPAFKGCQNIIQMNLAANMIQKMDCFEELPKLQKLYLENNQISRLEGLSRCQELRELFIGNQRTKKRFTLDEYSLAAISGSLSYLDMPSVNLVECKALYYLENLGFLNLQNNHVSDLQNELAPVLMTCQRIRNLQM